MTPIKPLLFILLSLLVTGPLTASAAPASPTLVDQGDTVVLSNGLLTATVSKSSSAIKSLRFRDTEFVRPDKRGAAYFSMDGGSHYMSPWDCKFSIHAQSEDLIDIGMRQTWTTQHQAVDVEIHYVLRAGDTGIYAYAILDHPPTYPATGIGEWRMVWKLPDDLLDTICVDRLRYRQMPSSKDTANAEPTGIKEIIKLRSGVRAGKFECKYDYNANYYDTPFWGHADRSSGLGAWMISGAHEWFNDGPTKQDLTAADHILHIHFGMNHYNGSTTSIAAGESWRKIYGPFLLYLNHATGGTDAVVRDARQRASAERAAWPYAWLTGQPEFPPSDARGSASGSFRIRDPHKPALTGANAWIGLAQPDPGGNWQFESKRYQYWSRVEKDGSFTIPHVRPGSYTLYAFADGAVGEYEQAKVEITAGTANPLGDITWEIPRDRGALVWEIGTPDRSAAEFRHGDDYFQGYLWTRFAEEWPNPLEFTIGRSDPARDWNYAHSGYPNRQKKLDPWRWQIHFDLDRAPSADATLTVAIASADGARLDVFSNRTRESVATFTPSIQGGNALLREGIHAKYCFHRVTIPAASLRRGKNTLTLVQSRTHSPALHVMYDYLSLEVPETPASSAR